ncbi:hypothetical protein NP233_g5620 [Leucocoprinus birnbaumii]|uniref:DUF6534 domain-containing protein n=1 Tax=Leucocoprinus birnbaumii TaxID=56174 RepID=A0AAD5VSI3_9AGAR|nr:hypothetical protein NP233_g5620 [Leucocoprinus birnbaumii]
MATLDATYGSVFIGLIVASILYGVTLLQTFLYFSALYCSEPILRTLANEDLEVAIVWLLDTAQLTLCTIAMYWYLVSNFSNEEALKRTTCFFARRVWIMSGNAILTLIIVLLACVHFAVGAQGPLRTISLHYRRVRHPSSAENDFAEVTMRFLLVENTRFSKLIWVTSAGLGSAAAADVIIACALCYYLLKSRTGFSSTDSLIATLIGYSLTTGLITSLLALICVVTFATMPTNYIWLAFFWILGKCYVNSLLAALNSRDSLRERVKPRLDGTLFQLSNVPQFSADLPESPTGVNSKPSRRGSRSCGPSSLAVNVHTQTYCKSDFDKPEYLLNTSPPLSSKSASFIV